MYNKFDGTNVNAADNNPLLLLLWIAGWSSTLSKRIGLPLLSPMPDER